MRHYDGHSIEEIGAALGMKTNATKHSIFRAVKKMRAARTGRQLGLMTGEHRYEPARRDLILHFYGEAPGEAARIDAAPRRMR